MNFDATGDTFKGLFNSTRFYQIPRFQRDFSWKKTNNDEFLTDLMKQIDYDHEKGFYFKKYYLGNMIFLGAKDQDSVQVIDGQQRLTAGTILLAALRDSFTSIATSKSEPAMNYAETIQSEYLVKKIDGTPQRKLETTTTFPYFAESIQGITPDEEKTRPTANTDEEKMLKETFENFKKKLGLQAILSYLLSKKIILDKKHTTENKQIYISFLKAIRDTFLASEIVEIFVADDNEAYRIFENINSKGQPLNQVDLIKNDIFSKIDLTESGVDTPTETWKQINKTFSKEDTNFNEFFLHFWKALYPKDSATGTNLYKKYLKRYPDENADLNLQDLKKLLCSLRKYSKTYVQIITPSDEKYKKQEYKSEFRSLDTINKLHGIQSRVPLLALFIKKETIHLKQKKVNDFLSYLANFHLAAFGTSYILRGNVTTTPYKTFCNSVMSAKNANTIYTAMDILEEKLREFINKEDFKTAFKKLSYSKSAARTSLDAFPASYAINTISNAIDNRSFNDDQSSIEHILDESSFTKKEKLLTTNIGNITVLERYYNDKLGSLNNTSSNDCSYKQSIYEKSAYKITNSFFDDYPDFHSSDIERRSEKLANFFWEHFLEEPLKN